MRVLQVPPFVSSRYATMEGGSERYCFNLSKKLKALGHEPVIYTSKLPLGVPGYEVREGIPIHRFRCWGYFIHVNPVSFFIKEVHQHLKDFDLIHAHSYIFFFSNELAVLRRMVRFPFILHLHGGLDYISPSVIGVKASTLKVIYDASVGKYTIRGADRIISCCETDRLKAIHNYGADPDRVVTIHNCIDSIAFRQSEPHNPVNVTFIGRLSKLKGCHQLPHIIKAITREHKNVRFTIVGEGGLDESLRSSLRNEPVTFTGVVPNPLIPGILASSHIFILPSFLEGFPLVVLEAHASSVPVVCYDVGGCWESVRTGETGELVPVGDSNRFIEALSWLIDNEEARVNMGKLGRKNVLEKYDWPVAMDKILGVYHSVV